MIVIGDVHGCFDTLRKLIDKLPDDDICFVGDLIDRGPESAKVVQFVIDNGFDCVMGNHEELMVHSVGFADLYATAIWHRNGGMSTEMSYEGDFELEKKHFNWMKNLPIVKDYAEIGLLVSHSTCANYVRHDRLPDYKDDVLWGRNSSPRKIEGYFNVFGHTPTENPIIKEWWANIDTGCVFGYKLTALRFPQMEIYQQLKKEKN